MATTHLQLPAYSTGPRFVVRIAGMPVDRLDQLRASRTLALLDELRQTERWLDAHRDALCDALHARIGGNTDSAARRRLIALRRDVHDDRPSKLAPAEVAPALAEPLAQWAAAVARKRELAARAEAELAAETAEIRRAIHALAGDPQLRCGLVLASPSLFASLERWLAAPRPDAKLERRLVKYLSRTAAKTSPYSTFTSVAEGRWSAGPAVRCAPVGPDRGLAARRSVVELNAFTLRQLCHGVARLPEVRPRLALAVNPSLVEADGVLRFVAATEREAVIELAASPTLRRFVAEVRGGATYAGIVAALGDGDRAPEVARFLDKLVALGLFELGLAIPDADPDPLGALERELGRLGLGALAAQVGALRGGLARYAAAAEPAARFAQAGAIRDALAALYRALGGDPDSAAFPRHPFYEDTLVPGVVIECGDAAWTGVRDDLHLVQQLAGAFDRFLPGRIAAAAFVEDRYGAGARVPLLALYGAFCRELQQPAAGAHRIRGADLLACYERPYPVPDVGLPRLAEVAAIQRRIIAYVAGLPVQGGVKRAEPAAIRALVAELPAFVPAIESTAFHGQVVLDGGRPQLVLNELVMGFGRSRARLRRLDAMSGGEIFAPPAPATRSGGRRHAELGGAMASNLNLRAPTAPLEITYPGSVSARPADERIALGELIVVHDPATGELALCAERTGERITPVHLGAMVEFLLPPVYRFVLQLFGQAVPRFELLKTLGTAAPSDELDGVRRYPRLYLGDVVLDRAAWTMAAPLVPRRARGEPELAFLRRVGDWRARHGLPLRCFVRTFGQGFARPSMDTVMNKARKPLYVDFASPVLLDVLDHLPVGADRLVVFEEMLPAPEDAVVRDQAGAYVSELVIELTARGGA